MKIKPNEREPIITCIFSLLLKRGIPVMGTCEAACYLLHIDCLLSVVIFNLVLVSLILQEALKRIMKCL